MLYIWLHKTEILVQLVPNQSDDNKGRVHITLQQSPVAMNCLTAHNVCSWLPSTAVENVWQSCKKMVYHKTTLTNNNRKNHRLVDCQLRFVNVFQTQVWTNKSVYEGTYSRAVIIHNTSSKEDIHFNTIRDPSMDTLGEGVPCVCLKTIQGFCILSKSITI